MCFLEVIGYVGGLYAIVSLSTQIKLKHLAAI